MSLVYEDMTEILLMLKMFSRTDSEIKYLLSRISFCSVTRLFFNNYPFSLRLEPVEDNFRHYLARMANENQ